MGPDWTADFFGPCEGKGPLPKIAIRYAQAARFPALTPFLVGIFAALRSYNIVSIGLQAHAVLIHQAFCAIQFPFLCARAAALLNDGIGSGIFAATFSAHAAALLVGEAALVIEVPLLVAGLVIALGADQVATGCLQAPPVRQFQTARALLLLDDFVALRLHFFHGIGIDLYSPGTSGTQAQKAGK